MIFEKKLYKIFGVLKWGLKPGIKREDLYDK